MYTRWTYRRAFPLLLEDFDSRCAYSQVHVGTISDGEMHVDHHDPRKKSKSPYTNLFPAYGLCNEAKGDLWPGKDEIKAGMRYLNPCLEADYNYTLFEDPKTHELVGTTPAARYHIDMLDLNNPALVFQRKERTAMHNVLNSPSVLKTKTSAQDMALSMAGNKLLECLALKIPPIAPPPKNWEGTHAEVPDNS